MNNKKTAYYTKIDGKLIYLGKRHPRYLTKSISYWNENTLHKSCNICENVKPLSEYTKYARKQLEEYSHFPVCKTCRNEKAHNNYYSSIRNRAKSMISVIKNRAKKNGWKFELSPEWFISKIENGKCEVTGIPFDLEVFLQSSKNRNRKGIRSPFAPSVDRINSFDGYTLENTRVVCTIYNVAKGPWSDDDVKSMAYYLTKNIE